MTKAIRREINLPFSGFYESMWSDEIDQCERMEVENFDYTQKEECVPPELRLDSVQYSDILFECTKYNTAYERTMKWYVDAVDCWFKDEHGWTLGLQYNGFDSPREYNFTTDRVFATIPMRAVRKLFSISRKEKHVRLEAMILERHSSRSGFHSWYSNELAVWLVKPLNEWDHNELGTLFRAVSGWNHKTEYSLNEEYSGDSYAYYDPAIDWDKVNRLVEEKRQELLSLEREFHDPTFTPPTPRCPYTIDLFR